MGVTLRSRDSSKVTFRTLSPTGSLSIALHLFLRESTRKRAKISSEALRLSRRQPARTAGRTSKANAGRVLCVRRSMGTSHTGVIARCARSLRVSRRQLVRAAVARRAIGVVRSTLRSARLAKRGAVVSRSTAYDSARTAHALWAAKAPRRSDLQPRAEQRVRVQWYLETQECCIAETLRGRPGAAPHHAHEVSSIQHSSISRCIG